ncbi:MAG: low molecular weight protein-tyrosine-phosphatase [Pseudomonadota bacterium]
MGSEPVNLKHKSILFVCLGNICRSAMAEGIFRKMAVKHGHAEQLFMDSAGTGSWHIGNPPDSRAIAKAREHGIDISGQRGRQVGPDDFDRFDLMLAMDRSNLDTLKVRAPAKSSAHVALFLAYASGREDDVPDPYYGGPEGFEQVYRMIETAGAALLERLEAA